MEILRFTPTEQLIQQVRNTTMLTDKAARPYENATICYEEMPLEEMRPTQLYVLRNHLEIQNDVRNELLEKGHDSLRLYGSIILKSAEVTVGMMPPVVEDDEEYGPCLLDGTHRAYLAKQLGMKTLGVLRISGVPKDMPMIAYPNCWNELIEYDTIPVEKNKKKYYRNLPKNKYEYYRDFSEITGIGKDPRSEMVVR